jgi:hypothetical protein
MLREAISIKRLTSQRYEKYFMPEYGNGQGTIDNVFQLFKPIEPKTLTSV